MNIVKNNFIHCNYITEPINWTGFASCQQIIKFSIGLFFCSFGFFVFVRLARVSVCDSFPFSLSLFHHFTTCYNVCVCMLKSMFVTKYANQLFCFNMFSVCINNQANFLFCVQAENKNQERENEKEDICCEPQWEKKRTAVAHIINTSIKCQTTCQCVVL